MLEFMLQAKRDEALSALTRDSSPLQLSCIDVDCGDLDGSRVLSFRGMESKILALNKLNFTDELVIDDEKVCGIHSSTLRVSGMARPSSILSDSLGSLVEQPEVLKSLISYMVESQVDFYLLAKVLGEDRAYCSQVVCFNSSKNGLGINSSIPICCSKY